MPNIPRIANPFENDSDQVDEISVKDLVKEVGHEAAKGVNKEIIKPTVDHLNTDQAIVDFLYGASSTPKAEAPDSPEAAAAAASAAPSMPEEPSIEFMSSGSQAQQAAKMQQIIDPDKQMSSSERSNLTKEQMEQREKARLHQRNYYTMENHLDDIGFLEEQIARVRRQNEEEEQQKKKEEEEEEERKKQEEEEKKQQLAEPEGKKTGVPEHVKREQNKAENKMGFSG